MVAVIKTGHSLHRILNYNEAKVKQGVAACIGEANYPMDVGKMNFSMKLNRLLHLAELNANVTRNSVHVSLNFDTSEKDLEKEKLVGIAREYMQRIGFENQPCLIYQHHDAGHPHIHIVSVKVRPDGSRIDMQNIGKNQSEAARLEIEKKYGLVPAGKGSKLDNKPLPYILSKVEYGKTDSKRAITNILDAIIPNYRFASLHELNAVLRQYNIMADRGSEKSRMFKANGLAYRILDDKGQKVGVPIKASSIYSKPTLASLEKRYGANEVARSAFKSRLKNTIDRCFLGRQKTDITAFCKALDKDGIHAVLRQNEAGRLYGITYVDHSSKCVFNGSTLGKAYSAKGILERCEAEAVGKDLHPGKTGSSVKTALEANYNNNNTSLFNPKEIEKAIDVLIGTENTFDYVPKQFKKKKRRKGQSGNL